MDRPIKNIISAISFIATVLIAVIGFELRQNTRMGGTEVTISAHDVRLNHLEKNIEEIKSVRRDVAAVREQLARITAILEQSQQHRGSYHEK